jgi:hypothetical protein
VSYFGYGTTEQELLDLAKSLKEERNLSDKELICGLVSVIQYFAED